MAFYLALLQVIGAIRIDGISHQFFTTGIWGWCQAQSPHSSKCNRVIGWIGEVIGWTVPWTAGGGLHFFHAVLKKKKKFSIVAFLAVFVFNYREEHFSPPTPFQDTFLLAGNFLFC